MKVFIYLDKSNNKIYTYRTVASIIISFNQYYHTVVLTIRQFKKKSCVELRYRQFVVNNIIDKNKVVKRNIKRLDENKCFFFWLKCTLIFFSDEHHENNL